LDPSKNVKPIIIFGAYGVFGSHVARELGAKGLSITIAGRDLAKAESFARTVGPNCRTLAADLTDPLGCRDALEEHAVVVNCAGPFGGLGNHLLEACLDRGCDYCDIADDRGYAATVRGYNNRFRERGLAAVYGCSSLPGISGALAQRAYGNLASTKSRSGEVPNIKRVRVTLFIGNKNPKGRAAVGSLVAQLGRPIAAPQGSLRGFRDRELVSLPPPFHSHPVFNFESPDYDLLPLAIGARAVSVKVGFEFRLGSYAFALLAWLGLGYGRRTAALLDLPRRVTSWFGHSGGVVLVELFTSDGNSSSASASGSENGQHMAALPCAMVANALATSGVTKPGASTAYEYLGTNQLLDGLALSGFTVRDQFQASPNWSPAKRMGKSG
jgi:hypothetical protein